MRVAVLTTAYFSLSHADVMVTRWLEPLAGDAAWGWPPAMECRPQLVSLYIGPNLERKPGDRFAAIGPEVAARHNLPLCHSIEQALTLGTGQLAVDAVLFVGEHGDYPSNELGQKLYPRYQFFKEAVRVMRQFQRFVPIFTDKHLSFDNALALEMARTAQQLGIPLMAGSSLPHCAFIPALPGVNRRPLQQGVTLFYGGVEAYGFHALEVGQSVFEKRRGGESGIRRVQVLKGATLRRFVLQNTQTLELLQAALAVPGREAAEGEPGRFRRLSSAEALEDGMAFRVEHADGFCAMHYLVDGHWPEFTVGFVDEAGSCHAARVQSGDGTDFYAHFAAFNAAITRWLQHGTVSAPIDRTLLTTLTINTLMRATKYPNVPVETPHLLRPYRV